VTKTCSIAEGGDIFRKRLRQLDKFGRAPPDKVIIEVAQPKAITTYYKGAGTIDQRNRIRANELRMDRNLATRQWDKRFNLGVLGIICVDAYLFFQQVVHAGGQQEDKLPQILLQAQGVVNAANAATPTVKSTLRFKSGKVKRLNQGRCSIKGCTKHSVYVCSVCTHATDAAQKQFWFCNPMRVEGSD
jgi:hypothetical protein